MNRMATTLLVTGASVLVGRLVWYFMRRRRAVEEWEALHAFPAEHVVRESKRRDMRKRAWYSPSKGSYYVMGLSGSKWGIIQTSDMTIVDSLPWDVEELKLPTLERSPYTPTI